MVEDILRFCMQGSFPVLCSCDMKSREMCNDFPVGIYSLGLIFQRFYVSRKLRSEYFFTKKRKKIRELSDFLLNNMDKSYLFYKICDINGM